VFTVGRNHSTSELCGRSYMCFDVQVYNMDIVAGVSLHLLNYWHPRNRTRNAYRPIDHLQVLVAFQ